MTDLQQSFASGTGSEPDLPVPTQPWHAEANPDLGYGDGDPAEEPPPVDPDKDQPGDPPPAKADLDYGDDGQATEPPPVDPEKDLPGDPPSLEVAEHNGR